MYLHGNKNFLFQIDTKIFEHSIIILTPYICHTKFIHFAYHFYKTLCHNESAIKLNFFILKYHVYFFYLFIYIYYKYILYIYLFKNFFVDDLI